MLAQESAVTKTAKPPVDAVALLARDHRALADLLNEFEYATGPHKAELANRICANLTAHMKIEEAILYPAARAVLTEECQVLLDEADIEHGTFKRLIARIQTTGAASDQFHALVMVLGDFVKFHVNMEERELFPKLRQTELDLGRIGAQLAELKEQLASPAHPSQAALETARG
jgi:hemerythrin-like domain-containing protein